MTQSMIDEILGRHVPAFGPGRLPAPDRARCQSAEERAELWRARAVRRHEARVPPEFARARLAAAAPSQVARWVRGYCAGDAGDRFSLMLSGRVGRGKTYLAYAALRAVAEAGVEHAAWAGGTVSSVFARMRPGSGEERSSVVRELASVPILLLDDVGAGKGTEWTEETFLDLLDARSRSRRPVIVTTNATSSELRGAIGDRALSRLGGMCLEVAVEGDDRRLA
jgi:DNA replication protein DnaC